MYDVYIIQNPQLKYYIGQTNNIKRRVEEHNTPNSYFCRYTRNKGPWKLAYTETYNTRSSAIKRESEIKNQKSKKYIKNLIDKNKCV